MGLPNDNEARGAFNRMKGSVKESVGKAVGDDRLTTEGKVERAEGNVEQNFGKARRKVGETIEGLGDAIKR